MFYFSGFLYFLVEQEVAIKHRENFMNRVPPLFIVVTKNMEGDWKKYRG